MTWYVPVAQKSCKWSKMSAVRSLCRRETQVAIPESISGFDGISKDVQSKLVLEMMECQVIEPEYLPPICPVQACRRICCIDWLRDEA